MKKCRYRKCTYLYFRAVMTLLFMLSGFIHGYAEKVLIDYVYYELDETTQTAKVVGLEIYRNQGNGNYYSRSSYHIQAEITHENHQYKITDISSLTLSIPHYWYTTSKFYAGTNTITIGEGILHISDSAFKNATFHPYNYTQPKSIFSEPLNITLPNSLQSIGNEAFEGIKFNQLTLPDHLVSIGDNAFKDCRINNTSFSIPNSVASIGEGAFMNCVDIKDLTISNSLTAISSNAFAGCVNVEEVTVRAPWKASATMRLPDVQ